MKISYLALIFLAVFSVNGFSNHILDDSIKVLNNSAADLFIEGYYEESVEQFKKTLNVALLAYPEDHPEVADILNNIGVVQGHRWQYEEASFYLKKALSIYDKNAQTIYAANTYSNIGNIYRKQGDYQHAIEYYNKTIQLLTGKNSKIATQRRLEVYVRYSLLEMERSEYHSSIKLMNKALSDYMKSGGVTDTSYVINVYINQANAYSYVNKPDSCNYYFNLAINSLKETSQYSDHDNIGLYSDLADHFLRYNRLDTAFSVINKSRYLLDINSVDSINYYKTFSLYAEYYKKKEKYIEAIGYLDRTLNLIAQPNYNETEIKYSSQTKAVETLQFRAACLIAWYQQDLNTDYLVQALDNLKTSTKLIDQLRNSYLSIESKLFIANNQGEVYDLGLYCASELFKQSNKTEYLELAFYFSEKGKSTVLTDALNDEKAKEFAGIPESISQHESSLKKDISFYNEMLSQENLKSTPDSLRLQLFKTNIFKYTLELEELKDLLEDKYPEYYTFKYTNTVKSLSEIQKRLSYSETLIEYSVTDSILYTFVINKHNVNIYTKSITVNFNRNINLYLTNFRNFQINKQGKNIYKTFEVQGLAIYNSISSHINKTHLKKNLIIVPDGILSYLPFESLVTHKNEEPLKSFADINYLLYNHLVSYSYTASLFYDTKQKSKRKFRNSTLAIAPSYAYNPNQTISDSLFLLRDNLTPLPNAKIEAKTIAQITKGNSSLNEGATEINFKREAEKYDILHLAMHTLIDDKNPLHSKLIFYSDNYDYDHGLLNTKEIFSLKLKAGLTVLSACSSGDGNYSKGEGVMSLSRGFFYAGCPSLVMTLWKVEDESSLKLMKLFYKNILKGKSKSESLRSAKMQYLQTSMEQNKHPFFWSTFVLIGNSSPIYYSKSFILIPIFLLLIIFALFKRVKKRLPLPEPNLTDN